MPNNHHHPCVSACYPVCWVMSVFPTHVYSISTSQTHTHTFATRVWREASAASVVFVMVATECSRLVRFDWCVRTDKNMSLARSFYNTVFFSPLMSVGDIQDQVDSVYTELFNLKIFVSRKVTIRWLQRLRNYLKVFKWNHSLGTQWCEISFTSFKE